MSMLHFHKNEGLTYTLKQSLLHLYFVYVPKKGKIILQMK